MAKKNRCENCKYYNHTPNILGGIAECAKDIKPLDVFWINEVCDEYESTNEDKLKAQNDLYKVHFKVNIR
jgi:hypothetical protein